MMKNLKKAELIIILLTVLCLVFTAGYFIGRGTAVQVIAIDKIMSIPKTAAAVIPAADTQTKAPEISTPPAATADPQPSPDITPALNSEIININTASRSMLDELPGIGPVLAQNIIDYREKNGGFKSIEDLKDVDGIGEKKFNTIKNIITIG